MQAGRKRLASRMPAAWPALLAGGVLLLAAFAPTAQGQQAAAPKLSAPVERAAEAQPPSLGLSLLPPAEAALPPLRPDELERLRPQANGPTLIGVHRQLPDTVQLVSVDSKGSLSNKTKAVKQADALIAAQKIGPRNGLQFMPWTAAAQHVQTFVPGAWQATIAGRVWRLQITSPAARALRLHFKNFNVGKGRVWLHNKAGQVYGPYTGQGMFGDGDFWSDSVPGDHLTIEYQPDPMQADAAHIKAVPFRVRRISHRVRDLPGLRRIEGSRRPPQKSYQGGALSPKAAGLLPEKQTEGFTCHRNVRCFQHPDMTTPEEDLRQGVHIIQLAAGVGIIYYQDPNIGERACSGVAINHKDSTRAPYDPDVHDKVLFLTAAHCIYTEEVARSAVVHWNYEAPCQHPQYEFGRGPSINGVPQTRGAEVVTTTGVDYGSNFREGDVTLLKLTGSIPSDAKVVLQGWDAGKQPPRGTAVGIHHPNYGHKAISIGAVRSGTLAFQQEGKWTVAWLEGRVEGGSSGSPLFIEGKVRGILSSGDYRDGPQVAPPGLCSQGKPGYYSKFGEFYERHAKDHLGGDAVISTIHRPVIGEGGVVLATGHSIPRLRQGEPFASPGAIISIYGQHFVPPGVTAKTTLDDKGRVATKLAGVCVRLSRSGWFSLPLFLVSPTQINAQLPYDLKDEFDTWPLDSELRLNMQVAKNCDQYNERVSYNVQLYLNPTSPAFFAFANDNPDGRNPIAATHGGGSDLVGPVGSLPGVSTSPARRGAIITVYGTGFGDTEPPLEAGQIPGGVFELVHQVSFRFGDVEAPSANILYAGAAPCCAGLYQFVLRIPENAPTGNVPLIAVTNGISSPEVPYIAIGGGQQ